MSWLRFALRQVKILCLNSAQRKLVFVRAEQIGVTAKSQCGAYERNLPRTRTGCRGYQGHGGPKSVRGDMLLTTSPHWIMDWDLRRVRVTGPQDRQHAAALSLNPWALMGLLDALYDDDYDFYDDDYPSDVDSDYY